MTSWTLQQAADVAILVQTGLMATTVAVAAYQISVFKREAEKRYQIEKSEAAKRYEFERSEASKWRTIESCERYDTDPVIDNALRRIHTARSPKGDFEKNGLVYKPDVATVLNYLDGIAIGIAQGVLVEAIVKDLMESIFLSHYKKYFASNVMELANLDRKDYKHFQALMMKWQPVPLPNFSEK